MINRYFSHPVLVKSHPAYFFRYRAIAYMTSQSEVWWHFNVITQLQPFSTYKKKCQSFIPWIFNIRHVHYSFKYTWKLKLMQTQIHYISFESISENSFKKRVYNHFTGRYVLNRNFFSFCGVSNKMAVPLNMLSFPMECYIQSTLNGNSVVTHQLSGSPTLELRLRSLRKFLSHIASWVPRQQATYSASIVNSAMQSFSFYPTKI